MQKEDARADAAIRELVVRKNSLRKMWILGSMGVGWTAVEVAAGLGLLGVSMGSPVFLGIVGFNVAVNMMGAGILGIKAGRATTRVNSKLEAMSRQRSKHIMSPIERIDAAQGSTEIKELAKRILCKNMHIHSPPRPFSQDENKEDVKGETVVFEDKNKIDSAPESPGSVLNALPDAETMVAKMQKRHALQGPRVLLESGAIRPPGRGRMRV